MFKVIQKDNGKYTYKEIDQYGNSVRIGEEEFATDLDCQDHISNNLGGIGVAPEAQTLGQDTLPDEPVKNDTPAGLEEETGSTVESSDGAGDEGTETDNSTE